jgi:alanine racemase
VSAARVDLDAVRANVAVLKQRAGSAAVMAVVKADGYGHGMLPCARAALDGGATWLGLATADEAIALRAGGIDAPALAWLLGPGDDWTAVAEVDVDLGVNAIWALDNCVAAAAATGRPTRIHLKVDSGLGELGRDARLAAGALRPGPAGRGDLRPVARAGGGHVIRSWASPGDDVDQRGCVGEAVAGRSRRLLWPSLHDD